MGKGYNLIIHNETNKKIHIEKNKRTKNVRHIKTFDDVDIEPGNELGCYLENVGNIFKGDSIFYLTVRDDKSSTIGGINIDPNRTVVKVYPFKNGDTKESKWDKYMMTSNYNYPGSKPNNKSNHVYVSPN